MTYHDPVFPPNRREIAARLTDPQFLGHLEAWTCDQGAQIVSGIDPYGFNQADADNFEFFSYTLNTCLIASTIESFECEGGKFLKPLAVLEWAISKAASSDDYKLPDYVLILYEEKRNNLIKPDKKIIASDSASKQSECKKLPVEGREKASIPEGWEQIETVLKNCTRDKTKQPSKRKTKLNEWLRERWVEWGKPNAKDFAAKLKPLAGRLGNPVKKYYGWNHQVVVEWNACWGSTSGSWGNRAFENKVSDFRKEDREATGK